MTFRHSHLISSGISDGTPAVWLMGGADISLGTLVSSESKMVEENVLKLFT